MALQEANLSALFAARIDVDKLVLGKSMQHVAVRILRMWEARNPKLNGALMSLDLLMLDEKENLIQGSIYHRRIQRFKTQLEEGNMYLLSNFEVVPTYSHYKVTDNLVTIRFTDSTQIRPIPETVCSIKTEKFRLHSYAELLNFAGTNLHLLDVVGQILNVQGSNLEDSTSTQKIVLLLLLQDNNTVRVTLWEEQASNFREQFQQTGRKCNVMICTCLNPKMFAGKLHLSSSGSSRIFIGYTYQAARQFMAGMGLEDDLTSPTIVEENSVKNKMEMWSIAHMFQYISSGANQDKEVICKAKIVDICTRNGWKYLSCAACSKKLGRSTTSLICNSCNKTNAVAVARFRVELIVQNGDRRTKFVIFDREARKLTSTTAGEISITEEKPECLLELVGETFCFQIKISEYNFQSAQSAFQTFTVSRVFEEDAFGDLAEEEITSEIETSNTIMQVNGVEIKTEDGMKLPTFEEDFGTPMQDTGVGVETQDGMKLLTFKEDFDQKKKKPRLE